MMIWKLMKIGRGRLRFAREFVAFDWFALSLVFHKIGQYCVFHRKRAMGAGEN